MYSYRPQPRHTVKPKPYQRNKSTSRSLGIPKKFYFFGILTISVLGGLFYWLFLSSSFKLEKVQVDFARNFSSADLETLTWDVAHSSKFLPADNLLLFDKNELRRRIEEKYYLNNIKIKTRLPHRLILSFQEQSYGLAWQEDNKFYYINYQGDIIMEKDDAKPDITVIFNRGQAKKEGRKIKIEEKYLTFADKINQGFKDRIKGLNEKEIFVDDDLNTVKVQIKNGPVIKFNTEEAIDRQLIKLEALRREELRDGKMFSSKQYIDLRYGDRVFYQ
jgi:cell division septal protein FtsQ